MLDLMVKVAGVTFEGRQETLRKLRGTEPVRIVAEPDNPYDSNALAVHVAMSDGSIAHVGYVPRELAKLIAPVLDGEPIMVTIEQITGGFVMYDGEIANYGLIIHVAVEGEEIRNDTEAPF